MAVEQKQKLYIPYPVIVEGKYDKIRLSNVMEGQILTTDGFGIFRQEEKKQLLRRLAERTPLILLTDSDGGGRVIRSHLRGILPADRLIQVYIPRIPGREKRKSTPSAEGVLGVEGMEDDLLRTLLVPYAASAGEDTLRRAQANPLTKADLYMDGLTGGQDSRRRRDELAARLGLPPGMSSGALLEALRLLISYEEYLRAVGRAPETGNGGNEENEENAGGTF